MSTSVWNVTHWLVRYKVLSLVSWLAICAVFAFPARAADLLTGNQDFKLLASQGFQQAVDGAHPEGSEDNDYAWSMAWFRGKLLVGTGRFQVDPATGQPKAGQIWAYTPGGANGANGTWALVYESPQFLFGGGPREFGYRWMTQCRLGRTDYLFVSTLGTVQGNILYTTDGVNFAPVSRFGIPFQTVGFRTMVCFTEESGRRMLISSPVGRAGDVDTFDSDRTDNPIALALDDPQGSWRNYSLTGMGEADNGSFFSMYESGGWLYAGVGNEVTGGQLWRTRGCRSARSSCIPDWVKMIDRGGGRPPKQPGLVGNKGISDMVAFGNALYMGVSSPALDGDRIRAEMWRLAADGTFEVLIGEPRFNFGPNPNAPPTNPAFPANLRCGVPLEDLDGVGGANDCPPTTRRGAGYGVPGSQATGYPDGGQFYFWRVFNYAYDPTTAPLGDDRLYVGTLHGSRFVADDGVGFNVMATTDGVNWVDITTDGFGAQQQWGMRSIAATPYGLGVGGTHFRIGFDGEVHGANVWLGAPVPDGVAPVTTIASPPSPVEGATLAVRDVTFQWSAVDTPAPGSLPLTYATRLEPLESAFGAFGAGASRSYANLPDGNYTFHVIARDNAGNTESPGAAPGAANRRSFSVAAPDLPPSVSITVAPATPNTTGNVNFAWQATDDVTPASALLYNRWLEPLQTDTGSFAAGTTASYTGLADGAYTFHVKVKDGGGNVGAEATASFTVAVPPPPPGPPAAPSSATATLVGPRLVRVAWTDVAAETRYEVQRCWLAPRGCIYAVVVASPAADSTSYEDLIPGGSPAGNYRYQVRACNALSCSAWVATAPVTLP
ncbi:MAG: hypothetical protein IT521_00825 [Burkholderiales bacterium]|nr:hypothetical protein [Burkholderiales bacterium]